MFSKPPLLSLIVIIILLRAAQNDHPATVESFLLQPPTSTSTTSRPHHFPIRKQQQHRYKTTQHKAMAPSEQDRLLLTEPAQTAFIVAEMKSFLTDAAERNDGPSGQLTRWEMSEKDMRAANLIDEDGNIVDEDYREAKMLMAMDNNNSNDECGKLLAINILCNTTRTTFQDGFINQPGLLSSLGSAICYFRDAFRNGQNLAACERVGLSDYVVAHHITDMYHHRNFRGAYTKTLTPSGTGEIAARIAVGLVDDDTNDSIVGGDDRKDSKAKEEEEEEEEDECILWSPTTPDVCIHWKSDDEAWRKKRFERIQMEGTKDPRRGGSGTMR